jgi:hypothetical protein
MSSLKRLGSARDRCSDRRNDHEGETASRSGGKSARATRTRPATVSGASGCGLPVLMTLKIAVNSYAALPGVRVLGRPMGSSAFIFASAASTIAICELWRRSNSRRTEFSGTPSSLASLVLDQPRLRIVS